MRQLSAQQVVLDDRNDNGNNGAMPSAIATTTIITEPIGRAHAGLSRIPAHWPSSRRS